jgi:hypothetical protein
MGLTLCLLLIAPAAYAATTWDFPVEGTFPAAGPHAAGAVGRLGVDPYAMRTLAHRSAGAQRIPVVDYLIAAAAQETGAAVLHYDRDYDTLAEIMGFESVWLAPPGSLP